MKSLLVSALNVSLGITSITAEADTWRLATSVAEITFSNGTPTHKKSRFCVLSAQPGVSVAFEGGTTRTLVTSETRNDWSKVLTSGQHTLDADCYTHQVGTYSTLRETTNPQSKVTWNERYIATNINMPGVSGVEHTEVGTSLQNRGTSALGSLQKRFLIHVHGLDDQFYVEVNGVEVLRHGFNQVKIYEVTQHLRTGANSVKLVARDKNNGRCWDFGHRVGDGTAWKFAEHYANTTCSSPLGSTWKDVYRKTYTFNFAL